MTITRTQLSPAQMEQLMQMGTTVVPCNGCRECCKGDLIVLKQHLGDRLEDYKWRLAHNPVTNRMEPALERKPNGECIYLGATGCTIHDRAPVVCREFDCRVLFKTLTREQRRKWVKNGAIKKSVFDAARKRLDTLEQSTAKESVFDARKKELGC